MASTALITCKTDPVVKDQARRVFSSIGIDMSTAINMFLRQAIRCNGLPFNASAGPVAPKINPNTVYKAPLSADGVPILPAEWDDPQDDIYDELYAND